MIALHDVSLAFGSLNVLDRITFSAERGEFLSIVGPSGCGKTSLLRLIAGLLRPAYGTIAIDGRPPEEARQQGQIGFCFQRPVLLPWRNILDNVSLPLELIKNGSIPRRDPAELLKALRLTGFETALPRELSGGMQQRAALARALISNPSILLMDEPFAACDELLRDQLDNDLRELTQALGQTVIFVTHSVSEATLLSDNVLVLSARPASIRAKVAVSASSSRREFGGSPAHADAVREVRKQLLHV